MKVKLMVLGQIQTNTYIVSDEESGDTIIIDPAAEEKKIIELIDAKGLHLKGILITHGHFDHIGAANGLREYYNVPVIAHKEEALMMSDGQRNRSIHFLRRNIVANADQYVTDNEEISFSNSLKFKCFLVPGHSSHSMCYYNEKHGLLFTGDTLMAGTIGRTDLFNGPSYTLVNNIINKLLILPEDTIVYPGHGPESNIGVEKSTNYYLKLGMH